MKKILFALLLLIVVAGLGATYFITQNLDSLIAKIIEEEGTSKLNTPVSVSGVITKLTEGKASISGINIANPAGYSSANAVSLNSIAADVDYSTQVIKSITINQPIINAELKGSSSNFQELLNNIPESADEEDDESSSTQEITISRLSLTKATVNLIATDYAPAAKYGFDNDLDLNTSFVMDDFVMKNITGTAEEITEEISTKLIKHITSQVKSFATAQIKAEATKQLKEKATEKIQEAIGDKLGDKLKGLF